MPKITVASWNGEWMNNWFTSDSEPAAFLKTFTTLEGEKNDAKSTAKRAAQLIRDIDPHVLALQEAPSRAAELELFIQEFLSDGGTPRYQFILGDSGGQQKLALLYKPDAVSAQLAPHASITNLIDGWQVDVDGDNVIEEYQFTRTPLVVNVTVGTHALQIIVNHTKSNFVNNGKQLWDDPATRQQYVVAALKARRRNSAECMHLRAYADTLLDADPTRRIMVVGDMNDGPGMDYFEAFYLTHSVTDILIGTAFEPEKEFTHAQREVPTVERYTAVFDDFVPTVQKNKHVLLDHMLLSPGLREKTGLRKFGPGAIAHAQYAANVVNNGKRRQDRPSDHRPVLVPLRY